MNTHLYDRLRRAIRSMLGLCLAGAALYGHAAPAAPATAQATPTIAVAPPCYGPRDPAPPVTGLTVVLIDRTAPKQGAAWRDFNAAVAQAAAHSGQRLVLLPFAGLAPGQTLARALDAVIEPPVSEAARQDMVIADFKRLQTCVGKRQGQVQQALTTLLAQLGQEDPAPLARSEVLYALQTSLGEFASDPLPLRLLVYSDGLQNGSGLNFYAQGAVRRIRPEQEFQRWLQTAGANPAKPPTVSQARPRVWWWGLLAQSDPTTASGGGSARYLDTQTLANHQSFWTHALAHLGVTQAQIGPTLNNPDLSFPSPGP